jgi:hypothetical protein
MLRFGLWFFLEKDGRKFVFHSHVLFFILKFFRKSHDLVLWGILL